jgi:hypothetical protein
MACAKKYMQVRKLGRMRKHCGRLFAQKALDFVVVFCDTPHAIPQKNRSKGFVMINRIARIFMPVLLLGFFLCLRPAIADGWSAPKLFPESKTETKKTPPKQIKNQPSALDKMTSGTKKFFSNVGSALGLKKSPPPKKTTMPTNPYIKPPKQDVEKASWLSPILPSEEPKQPKKPSDWMQQKRIDP